MEHLNTNKREAGFTLVELAVVMIIIGVLIGGVLKGQEMITNARVTATASQMESFQAAHNAFFDTYNSMPGDMPAPAGRIANCVAFCAQAGDGDGSLEVAVGAAPSIVAAGSVLESTAYFGHLSASGYISGVANTQAAQALAAADIATGNSNPGSDMPGGTFTIGDGGVGAGELTGATSRRPYITLVGGPVAVAAGTGVLSPLQAANIDRRLDDGNPLTGVIVGQNIAAECVAAVGNNNYAEATPANVCVIAHRL